MGTCAERADLGKQWLDSRRYAFALFKWLSAEYIPELGYFDPFAWQLLFFFGGALGYCKRQGELAWFHPKLVWLCAAIALVIFMAYRDLLTPLGITKQMVYAASSKPELGWLRILSLSVWIYLISVVIRFSQRH